MGTEKEGIGKFLYRLRQEVPYAQLSSQLAVIFYNSGAWEWNGQKRGMEFLLLPGSWQEKTMQYYRNSLLSENESSFVTEFLENSPQREEKQEEPQTTLRETIQEEAVQKIEQTKLSSFFGF
ncbi:hypothetical protein RSJ42_07925 [Methanosarcina hadiensis]|uniref:hypothetical protein n=1 Tax=Methanosarcina hadiensis TaxID=3078083 RepID=UPI0039772A2D